MRKIGYQIKLYFWKKESYKFDLFFLINKYIFFDME